jgi:hypothetical protein
VKKKIINITLVLVFIFSASVLAAAPDHTIAEKPVGSTSTVESGNIYGNYAYGNFAGRLYAGTGIGYAKLYRFIRYWPDEHIETLKVYTNGGENDFTHVWLEGNKLYNVTASGDRAAAVRAFIANYVN